MGLDSPEAAAAGIVDIVNENMLGGLRLVSVQQGFDPRDFALVAFGGAGPLHANALGVLTGAWPVIVPPSPGVLCALGDATTSLRDESARTVLRRFADLSGDELADLLGELAEAPAASLAEQGLDAAEQTVELPGGRPLPRAGLRDPDRGRPGLARGPGLGARPGSPTASTPSTSGCSRFLLSVDHELVNARATVTGPRPEVAADPAGGRRRSAGAGLDATRSTCPGAWSRPTSTTAATLRAGDVITGPAVITEMDSTTLVLPDHEATVHSVREPADQPRIVRRARRPEPWHRSSRPPRAPSRRPTSTRSPSTSSRTRLRNARYEMDEVLFRTALSPGIREQHDEFPLIADPEREDGGRPVRPVHPRLPRRVRRRPSRRATCCSPRTPTPAAPRSATPTTG